MGINAMRLSCFNPQFFIGSRVGDAALEAAYGAVNRRSRREMQVVIDALRALSTALPREQMPRHDRLAMDRLQELAEEMDRGGIHGADPDRLTALLDRNGGR